MFLVDLEHDSPSATSPRSERARNNVHALIILE